MIMHTVGQWYTGCVDRVKTESRGKLAILIAMILVLGSCTVGYRWYRAHKAQEVQKVLAECLDESSRAQRNELSWQDVELHFSFAYDHYSATAQAPYFLVGKAEAMLQQGKKDAALETMNKAIALLSSSSELYPLYCTKRALMRLDSADQKEAGLEELRALATNEKNKYRDRALYYLGAYYWSLNNLAEAKVYWKNLATLSDNRQPDSQESPWAALVTERLEQIV